MFESVPPDRALRCAAIALFLALALEDSGKLLWRYFRIAVSYGCILAVRFRGFLADVCIALEIEFPSSSTQPHGSGHCEVYSLCHGCRERWETDIHATGIDLRQLGQAEERLRESEEKYRLLVATIPEVVWKTDAKGNVIFVSPKLKPCSDTLLTSFANREIPSGLIRSIR